MPVYFAKSIDQAEEWRLFYYTFSKLVIMLFQEKRIFMFPNSLYWKTLSKYFDNEGNMM